MIAFTRCSLKRKVLFGSVAAGFAAMLNTAVQAEEADTAMKMHTLEEITVTARRRQENAQDIPVSVTAVGNEEIYRQNVTEIDDLTASIPGVNFTSSGGSNNTVFSIRGRSRGVFGNALPAVTTYVNEVPLSTWGGNIPTFDMASIQVLKGPQGTLFGRNSTAGAVLVTTQRPDHTLGGNVIVKVGEYNARTLEGAINIPVVQDVLSVRIAGQMEERDGFTDDVLHPSEEDYGNRDRENIRVSVLWEPAENISNLTIYENNKTDERAQPAIPVGFDLDNPQAVINGVPYYNGTIFITPGGIVPCGGEPYCDVNAMKARQDSAGVRKSWTDTLATLDQELTSWGNITTWDVGSFTLKNVFGYREVFTHSVSDIDGSQFAMIGADNVVNAEQYSNELQISGEAMDGALDYIGGLFWLKSKPSGGNRLSLQLFAQSGTPLDSTGPAPFNGAYGAGDFYTDTSKAVFGQVSYDLSKLSDSLEGLSVDVGVRHTKDKSESCPVSGTHITTPVPTIDDCPESRAAEFSKTTFNIGLNFQATEDVLLYAVTRSGYRAGGVNSPNLGGTLVDYQEYDPETVQDIEVGVKSDWSIGDINGRLNLALYHSKYKGVHYALPTQTANAILPGGVDGDGDPSNDPSGGLFYSNAGQATVDGVELELVVQLTQGLKASLGGSYMEKEFDPEFSLPSNFALLTALNIDIASTEDIEAFVFLGAPDWSYNANLEYTLPLSSEIGEVIVSADYFSISGIHYGGTIHAPEYDKVDIRVDWIGAMGSSIDVAMFVSNLTDEEAMIGPSSSSPGLGFNSATYNEPRMWGASLRYSF